MLKIQTNILKIRRQKGWTQRKLSRISKISQSCIANIERGRQLPNVYTLIALSRALNIKVGELVTVTEHGFRTTSKYF